MMKHPIQGFLALALTCVVYFNVVTGQILKNGSFTCDANQIKFYNFSWQFLQINPLVTGCPSSYNETYITNNVIGSVKHDALKQITGAKLSFVNNIAINGIEIYFNADLSGTPLVNVFIQNHKQLKLGKNVRFGKNVDAIHLNENGLKELPGGIFQKLRKLTALYLSHNRISSLEGNIFTDLEALIYLHIEYNRIEELPGNIFRGLEQLVDLQLEENRISSLEPDIFVDLKKLQTLDLSKNHITDLPGRIFRNLENLETLNLTKNRISRLDSGIFANLFWKSSTGNILPEIYVLNNKLTHLPYCLAQLKNFHYSNTSSIIYTGQQQQPENTEVKDICKTTIPAPFDWMYIIFTILFFFGIPVLGFIAWWIYKSKTAEDAEVARLAQKDSELRLRYSELVQLRLMNERNAATSSDLNESRNVQVPGTSKPLEAKQKGPSEARNKSRTTKTPRKSGVTKTANKSRAKKAAKKSGTTIGTRASKKTVSRKKSRSLGQISAGRTSGKSKESFKTARTFFV